jgi:hypothetical protein
MNVTLSDEFDFEDSDDSDSPDEDGNYLASIASVGSSHGPMSLVCMSHLTLFIHLRMILKMLMACKKPTKSFGFFWSRCLEAY